MFKYLITFLFIFLIAIPLFSQTVIIREPWAWGAILKYCLHCHGADLLDNTKLSKGEWGGRIDKCTLTMASQGYALPTKRERLALQDFMSAISAKGTEGGGRVYLVPPPRGKSPAVP